MTPAQLFDAIAKLSGLLFGVASMLAMGLSLTMAQILQPLKNLRLVILPLVASFVLVPLLAEGIVHVIPLDKLDYAEAQDDYVALHSAGKQYLKQQAIASLEAMLDPARFVRVHRSAIVNLERVTRIEPYGKESRIAILADGARLPVSRSGYARLLAAMGDAQGNRRDTR